MPSNSEPSTPPPFDDDDVEVEIGEEFEIVMDGDRMDAFISDKVVVFDRHSIHSRQAIRAYAYSLGAEDKKAAKDMLNMIGREG